MDTSSSIPNGSVNGYPSTASPCLDQTNGGSPSSSLPPELQDFVTKTFQKHTVLTLNELKRLFNLYLASMPAGQNVFGLISDHTLLDVVHLCKCKQIMVPFPAQSKAGPDEKKVFGLWEKGDDFDKYRRLLYDLFTQNYRMRRNVIQAKLAQEFGEMSKAELDRLLHECCISNGGYWLLKGTLQS